MLYESQNPSLPWWKPASDKCPSSDVCCSDDRCAGPCGRCVTTRAVPPGKPRTHWVHDSPECREQLLALLDGTSEVHFVVEDHRGCRCIPEVLHRGPVPQHIDA